jgi:hypothetical protein
MTRTHAAKCSNKKGLSAALALALAPSRQGLVPNVPEHNHLYCRTLAILCFARLCIVSLFAVNDPPEWVGRVASPPTARRSGPELMTDLKQAYGLI